ncbi:tyrosinase family oxidase copper chaperone [Streptomyces sp. NPDC088789]|uniref:tyrosinase family oxidase copper chaperone n=1 Tax=Streptomyces sp. NPDC088789 TaxID=3365899 RepID=UPI0037FB9217
MVVSDSGATAGADHDETGAGRPGRARGTRRQLLRGLLVSGAALAVTPLVVASRPDAPTSDAAFDEVYRGHRIRGARTTAGPALGAADWHVTVDGRPLHLMRRADGTWLSMIDHYRSYDTPLEAARAAVDELGPGERLREPAPAHPEGHRGVHA